MSKHGLMLFARHEDGRIIHVSEAERGKACRCECPECGATVEAHKGDVKMHTFHHSAGEACGGGPETALHKFAKQTFEEAKRLALPQVVVEHRGIARRGPPGGVLAFDHVILEDQSYTSVVPDAVGLRGETKLFLEFSVTHPCPPEKAGIYRSNGWNAVEVDLKGIVEMMPDRPEAEDLQRLREAILYKAPRHWVHNVLSGKLKEAIDREADERLLSMGIGLSARQRHLAERTRNGSWRLINLLEEAKARRPRGHRRGH